MALTNPWRGAVVSYEIPIASGRSMPPMRAAQYVRMSRDSQRYSIANQAEVIAAYARDRNITIVCTYADEGLSGLAIHWRDGLKALIADVESGHAEFDCVLVYDVTRWGRFQNLDESACYEFMCQRAGITVHYCADEFENDGSLASFMLKNNKRFNAADFSRQLSKKVFLGQSRVTRMGYWRGGMPGYGLRRQLLDETGVVRTTLEYGQKKYLQTDRIKIVHGPDREIETVRRIFTSFVSEGKYLGEIASELNAEQIRTTRGLRWNGETVGKILGNEAYIGSLIYNRSSYKLKQRRVVNPRDMWIRHDEAFPPVIAPELFTKAQEMMRTRRQQRTDQEAIDRLAALGREKGHLTTAIIAAADDILSAESYRRRFGSLVAAYELAGYQPEPRQRLAETADKYRTFLARLAGNIVEQVNRLGGRAIIESDGLLCLNDDCRISFGSARAVNYVSDKVRWRIHADRKAKSDLSLIVRMDASNIGIVAYYLLPTADLAETKVRVLRLSNPVFAQACRYDDLEALCRVCAG
ncbi:recombinase family protein [Bradyrhizobium yuanmingense]|nr:recombinase family protein [Bradyrhizobium yuanmingense]